MPRHRSALRNWSEYLALRGIAGMVQCLDIDQTLHIAADLGRAYWRLSPERRARAEGHIRDCFPEWTDQKVADVAMRSMESMFQVFMVDAIVTPRMVTPSNWATFVRFDGASALMDRMIRGEPGLFITGHCGNWELLAHVFAVIGYPVTALARPLDNPLLNRWLLQVREARGTRIVTKWGGTSVIQETLRSGGRVGILADQNAGDQGLFVPFFGRLASTYKSVGLMAMRYRIPVVAGFAYRVTRNLDYHLVCTDIILPEEWLDQPDPLFFITARYSRAIEAMIRRAPDQYVWVHRRWKSRPRHERLGRPVPRKLIEKLESLPWMTPGELDRIVALSNEAAARRAAAAG